MSNILFKASPEGCVFCFSQSQFLLVFLNMWNIKFKKFVIFASVLFLQPMVSPGSLALARRKSPPKVFSFFAEGGKASQEECDGERKIPRKLKHLKEYTKAGSYMGSETQTFEIKGKDDAEMWKHFFRSKSSCNAVLAKTPSSANKSLKDAKQELPPDEAAESDDDERTDDQPEVPQDSPAPVEKGVDQSKPKPSE